MKTIKTIYQSLVGLAASAMLAFMAQAESASAFTLITDPGDPLLVTGIEDLDVGGKLFDVEFEFGTFNDVYGNVGDFRVLDGDTPYFWGDSAGAIIAAESIVAALGNIHYTFDNGVVTFDGFLVPSTVVFATFLYVGYGDKLLGVDRDEVLYAHKAGSGLAPSDVPFFTPFAVFRAEIPEPTSTVAILAVAGTGLLATRKGKK